jgi:hypothetical protein
VYNPTPCPPPLSYTGNTQILSAWYDQGGVLQAISRRLKFGLLLLWGRWGLPIMHRKPILGVMGNPIHVTKAVGEPKAEEIDRIHAQFIDELQRVFNKYKALYGWPDKQLVIK